MAASSLVHNSATAGHAAPPELMKVLPILLLLLSWEASASVQHAPTDAITAAEGVGVQKADAKSHANKNRHQQHQTVISAVEPPKPEQQQAADDAAVPPLPPKARHKSLLPLDKLDWIGLGCSVLGLMLAAGGGIGKRPEESRC